MFSKYRCVLICVALMVVYAVNGYALNKVEFGPQYYPKSDIGRPVSGGEIYVGAPDTDPTIEANQKQVTILEEDGDLIEISQPIDISSGGVPEYNGSPVTIFVDGDYSLRVNNSAGSQVYYIPTTGSDLGFNPGNYYYPSSDALDHGIIGDSNTVKYYVDQIGSDDATLYFKQDSGDATTPYIYLTDIVIPQNIELIWENGAYPDVVSATVRSSQSIFYPNSSEADHGAEGNKQTVNYLIDTFAAPPSGTLPEITLILRHDSGGETTAYTFLTDEDFPLNVTVEFDPGAYIAHNSGVSVGMIPSKIKAGPLQTIFNGAGRIDWNLPGTVYPTWYYSSTKDLGEQMNLALSSKIDGLTIAVEGGSGTTDSFSLAYNLGTSVDLDEDVVGQWHTFAGTGLMTPKVSVARGSGITAFLLADAHEITFKNIRFLESDNSLSPSSTRNCTAFALGEGTTTVHYENMFVGPFSKGWRLYGCAGIHMTDVVSENCDDAFIIAPTFGHSVNSVNVENSRFLYSNNNILVIDASGTSTSPYELSFTNCGFISADDRSVVIENDLVDNYRSLEFVNCKFRNAASYALEIYGGSPSFVNCSMDRNDADGAIYIDAPGGRPKFVNCEIQDNVGNGVYINDGSPSFINCDIFDSTENGVYINGSDGDVVFQNGNIFDNGDRGIYAQTVLDGVVIGNVNFDSNVSGNVYFRTSGNRDINGQWNDEESVRVELENSIQTRTWNKSNVRPLVNNTTVDIFTLELEPQGIAVIEVLYEISESNETTTDIISHQNTYRTIIAEDDGGNLTIGSAVSGTSVQALDGATLTVTPSVNNNGDGTISFRLFQNNNNSNNLGMSATVRISYRVEQYYRPMLDYFTWDI